jgi:hypothetical protein
LANGAGWGYVKEVKDRPHTGEGAAMSSSGTIRHLAVALLALGMFTAVTVAQPPRPTPADPLADAVARQKVADQKAETYVLGAIADAEKQAKSNPIKAIQTLKAAQVNGVDLAAALSGEARKKLTDMLERKIASLQGRPVTDPGPKTDSTSASVKKDRETAFESYKAELKDVNDGIQKISKYQQAGLSKEADYELAKMAKQYPNNPSVIFMQEHGAFASRVKDASDFARIQSDRITLAMRDVDKSSLPAKYDVEFPADWKERTKNRTAEMKLTDQEKKIIEALNKPVSLAWTNRPFDEALQDLSDALGQKLFLDKKSVEDLGIDLRKPMSLQATGVSTRTVLRQTLAAQGLTFVVKDQVIQVVDVEKAKNMLVTRVYYLGDLVSGTGPFGAAQWGPFLNMQQTQANVDAIIKSITSSIDPLSWKERGGPCSITFHAPSMSIIVRASTEVQASLGTTFGGGK